MKIKNVFGKVIYSSEATSLAGCVENAVKDAVNLRRADLSDANLIDVYLRGASLSDANLSGASLSGASLSDANLIDVDLRRANLSDVDLSGANLIDVDLSGANLSGASLSGASLRGANLIDVDLRGANLRGASLSDEIKIEKQPIQVDAIKYYILIFDNHMKIGCEFHSISEWFGFDDRKILEMDGKDGLNWWVRWKDSLMMICAAEGRA